MAGNSGGRLRARGSNGRSRRGSSLRSRDSRGCGRPRVEVGGRGLWGRGANRYNRQAATGRGQRNERELCCLSARVSRNAQNICFLTARSKAVLTKAA